MSQKTTNPSKRPQPAARDKKCSICGERYVYPTKGSIATRTKCEICVELPPAVAQSMKRLSNRIKALEDQLSNLQT